jgi:hypothetical protein
MGVSAAAAQKAQKQPVFPSRKVRLAPKWGCGFLPARGAEKFFSTRRKGLPMQLRTALINRVNLAGPIPCADADLRFCQVYRRDRSMAQQDKRGRFDR